MIYCGDLFDVLPTLPENSIEACVTDPPYLINFMSREWDGSGVSFQTETWRQVYRALKPGGHLIAFGGTRTYHRMVCAIEDAGFEIRDQLAWIYGSGFPKSLNVSKAIDEAAGADRDVIGPRIYADGTKVHTSVSYEAGADGTWRTPTGIYNVGDEATKAVITAPATDAAKQWDGWGTALKPAYEPIVLARKPFKGSVANCVLTHGTGAINIDATRIGTAAGWSYPNGAGGNTFHGQQRRTDPEVSTAGRWPANVILGCCGQDPHDPGCAVALLDAQSGELQSGKPLGKRGGTSGESGIYGSDSYRTGSALTGYGDVGYASRFFYIAKPSREERDYGCWDLPARSGGEATDRVDGSAGVNSPRAGAGRTGGSRNVHPTVKPLELMRYLVRLITPPGGTVLDPFCGSGTTGMACRYELRKFIGVEREAEYVAIAERRIANCAPLFGDEASA